MYKNLAANKLFFVLGFIAGIAGTAYLNWRTYANRCELIDCAWGIGFPLPFYVGGGFAGPEGLVWFGLLADIGFALTAGLFSGWLFLWLLKNTRPG